MQLEYYVLNSNFNRKTIESFNIFRNHYVNEETIKLIKKYLRNQKKFSITKGFDDSITLYGFEAFCERLNQIIRYEEQSRCEYEILVGDLFEDDINKFVKIDCYEQCKPNIPIIAREVIYQYKEMKKKEEA